MAELTETGEPAEDALPPSARRALAVGLILTVTAVAFEALAVATVLPVTVRELGGLHLYGWVFSAFMLSQLVGITLWGRLADERGPAHPYRAGVALFAVGLAIGSAAPSMIVLVAGRVVQGLGAGGLSSTIYVAVGRGYPPNERPRLLAMLSTAWVAPGLVGPAVAGAVADAWSWRLVFVGLLPVLGLAAALTLPSLRRLAPPPGDPVARPEGQPLAKALRLAAGAGLALAGLGERSLWAMAPLVAVGALLGVPALRRLLPAGAFTASPGVPAAIAARGLLTFAFFGADTFIPLELTSLRGLSPTLAGLALTTASLTWATGSWVVARMADRWTRRASSMLGASLVLVGIGGVASVLWRAVPVEVTPLAWAVAGFGIGIAYQVGTLAVLEEPPPGEVGRTAASMQLADVLGVALGAGVSGAAVALAAAHGWGRAGGLAIAHTASALGAVVCIVASSRMRSR